MTWAQALPLWLTAALVLGAFLFVRRAGGGTALEELERVNRVLERRVVELEKDNTSLKDRVTALQATRDLSLVIMPVLEALTTHEVHASERAEASLRILELIAARLGPDPAAQAV